MIDSIPIGYLIPAILTALIAVIVIGGIALLWGLSPLLSPGPLTAATHGVSLSGYLSHAEFENDCLLCHAPWSRSSDGRCLACHIDTSFEMRRQADLHGRLEPRLQCAQCHPEHLGRQTQIANVTLTSYPHEQTGFDLVGSHSDLACPDCHRDNRYRIDTTCHSCHSEPEQHTGNYGSRCEQCHATPHKNGFMAAAWTPLTIDHSFFPLLGGHAAVACEQCHLTPQFEETAVECVACHTDPEIHLGWYGTACANCHTTTAWTPSTFDHNKLAFALTGKHAGPECQSCHPNHKFAGVASECAACHHEPDFHTTGQLGQQCQICHVADGWQPAFLRQHPFPINHGLSGQTAVNCLACHPQGYTTYHCQACHDDPVDPAAVMN